MRPLQILAGMVLLGLLGITAWALADFGYGPLPPLVPNHVQHAQPVSPSRFAGFEVKNEAEDLTILGVMPDGQIHFRIRPRYLDHQAVSDCTVYAIMLDSFGDQIRPNPGVHFGTVPAGETREGFLPIPSGAVRARIRTNGTWVPTP